MRPGGENEELCDQTAISYLLMV